MENNENIASTTDRSVPMTSSPMTNGTAAGGWEEDRHFQRVLEDTKTVSMVFYPLLCVTAALGNACVVYLVVSRRRMRSNVTNYFIASLAVSDGLMALICVPTNYVANVLLDYWPFGAALCPFVTYLQAVIVFQNAYTMLAMSLERYIAIMHPFLRRLGKRNCLQVVALCWLLAFLTPVPTAVTARLHEQIDPYMMNSTDGLGDSGTSANRASNITEILMTSNHTNHSGYVASSNTGDGITGIFSDEGDDNHSGRVNSTVHGVSGGSSDKTYWLCYESWPTERQRISYTMTIMLLQYFLPLGVLVFTYARIVHVIWLKDKQQAAPGQLLAPPGQGHDLQKDDPHAVTYVPNGNEKKVEKEPDPRKKVIKMMITVVGIYGICWLPLHVINIKSDIDASIWDYQYMRIIWICAHWLAMSSCAYNPFIYWWMNPRFREGYIDLFHRLACCCRCGEPSGDYYGRNVSIASVVTRNGHRNSQVTSAKGWHSTTQMVELSRPNAHDCCADAVARVRGGNSCRDDGYQPELSKISEATENGLAWHSGDQEGFPR